LLPKSPHGVLRRKKGISFLQSGVRTNIVLLDGLTFLQVGEISAQRAVADTAKSEFESVTVVASNLCGRKPARMRLQPPIRVIQVPINKKIWPYFC